MTKKAIIPVLITMTGGQCVLFNDQMNNTTDPADNETPDVLTDPAEEEQRPLPKPDYVKMTLDSNVIPLEMRYSQINDCYKRTSGL